jgi:hypothetical protein
MHHILKQCIVKPIFNYFKEGRLWRMTFAEYFKQMSPSSIQKAIDADQAKTLTPAKYAERVHFILKIAAKDPILPGIDGIDTTLLNQILVYSMYKMDRVNFLLVSGKKNINLHSDEVLSIALSDDAMMRYFPSLDIRREYATTVLITTILYLVAMHKKVEANTLLNMSADLNAKSLNAAVDVARDMLQDCKRFGKGAYDRYVLRFLNETRQSVGTVKTHQRAF